MSEIENEEAVLAEAFEQSAAEARVAEGEGAYDAMMTAGAYDMTPAEEYEYWHGGDDQ